MFQETLTLSQDSDTVEKAINFGAIAMNTLTISLTAAVMVAVFALKSWNTDVTTGPWIKANSLRFGVAGFVVVALSTLMVVSPNISDLFHAIGFDVSKSPIALGISIGLLLVGATAEPSKKPEG